MNRLYYPLIFLSIGMLLTTNSWSQTKKGDNPYINNVLETVIDHADADHHHAEDYDQWADYLNRPHPNVATINQYFQQAANEFGVPVELLQIIGQIENNWTQIGPGIDRGWGIMHLVENDYSQTLAEAAQLLGVSKQTLKDDPYQNIRGAAALLAKYAGPSRSSFAKVEDWFDATMQFSGLYNAEIQFSQAERYYNTLKSGITSTTVWGETISIPPHPQIDISSKSPQANNQKISSADYGPALSQITSCNFTNYRNTGIDTWVNHWIGVGTYAGAVSWFQNCNAGASAHFVIRSSDGQITQVVRVAHTAWHAGASGYNNNHRSIGVEHEATAANPGLWNSNAMLNASATMSCYFANIYNIPGTYSLPGIRGHNDMPGTATQCPGTINWNNWFNYFNAACSACAANLSLTGTIGSGTYVAGNNITATGTVSAGSNVTASAGSAVILDPGFDAYNNFTGEIGGCSPLQNPNPPTPSVFKSSDNWQVTAKQAAKVIQDSNGPDLVIAYKVTNTGNTAVQLLNEDNNLVAQQTNVQHSTPGTYVVKFSKADVPSGSYTLRVGK